MSQTDIKFIFALIWVNIIFNYWILRQMIKEINRKVNELEKHLIMFEIKKFEIKKVEKEKEENTLQK